MSYDYKIINIDPTRAFVKRALLYVAILAMTVSLALIILFILFERYLGLIAPGVLILLSVLTIFLIGKSSSVVEYHFTDSALIVQSGRSPERFLLSDISVLKTAENSDFFNKDYSKYSYIHHRIILKNTTNDNSFSIKNYIVTIKNVICIMALDDYALALIGGETND